MVNDETGQFLMSNPSSEFHEFRPGIVEVFCLVVPPRFRDLPVTLEHASRVLTEDEQSRFQKYRVQHRRNDLYLSRIMFKLIMQRLTGKPNTPMWIEAGNFGKPHVMSGLGPASIHVNTSNTAGMILWVLSLNGPIGCDVEVIAKDLDEVAAHHFAPSELASYRTLADMEKTHRFYETWTMKEAIIKADGRGLGIPLDSFACRFNHEEYQSSVELDVIDLEQGPRPKPWNFLSFRPTETHQVAVASSTSQEVSFNCHRLIFDEDVLELDKPWRFLVNSTDSREGHDQDFGVFHSIG